MDPTHYGLETFEAYRSIDQGAQEALARNIYQAWERGQTIYTCGNGGSYSNAQHLAQDLSKGTWIPGVAPLKTYHLGGNPSALTAYANDGGYEYIFENELLGLGQQGDVLIAISGSGNSLNVLGAIDAAHRLEMRTWGITGFNGGTLLKIAHRCIHVKSDNMGIVEAVHSILFHWLTERLRAVRAGEEALQDPSLAGAWCPGVER